MQPKEFEILAILCKEKKPLSLVDIRNLHPELNKNTLAQTLAKLYKDGWIEAVSYGKSNKTLCRLFAPTKEAKARILNQYTEVINDVSVIVPKAELCMALLKSDKDKKAAYKEMIHLQNMLNAYIKENSIYKPNED